LHKLKNFILSLLNKNFKIIFSNYLLNFLLKKNLIFKLIKFFLPKDLNTLRYKFKVFNRSFLCLMDPNDLRAIRLYVNNSQLNKFKLLVKLQEKFKFDYFYDFGGNYGEFSIVSADLFEKVHYFEPNPNCVFYLKKTLKESGQDNLVIYEKAIVKNFSENVTYLEVGDNSGSSSISDNPENNAIKVDTINISKIFNSFDLKKKIFIKMDIEGSENLVIEEFIGFFKNNFEFIFMFENNLSLENIEKLRDFIKNNNLFIYFLKHYSDELEVSDQIKYKDTSGEYILSNISLKS